MSNLTKRILSAAVLIPISLAFIFLAPGWLFSLFVVVLSLLIGYEYGTITLAAKFAPYRFFVSGLSGLLTAALAFSAAFPLGPVIALAIIAAFCPIVLMLGRSDFETSVLAAASCTSGALYSGLFSGFIALLFVSRADGSLWVFTMFLAAVLSDTGAYSLGRAFGRRKLAPRISPGKTWAGAFGGLLGTCLSVIAAKLFFLPCSPGSM